jgi:hypothetical protein
MALSVKKVTLWRREVENRPGSLAQTLAPLAEAGANLSVVMGYRYPSHPDKAAVELYPVTGAKATKAAKAAGLVASELPCVMVEGDNRAGLGHAVASRLAEQGVNMVFLIAMVIGRKYTAVLGFENNADATLGMRLIKAAAGPARKAKK